MKTIPSLMAFACAACACAAQAREAGDHHLQLGLVHVNTLDSSKPLHTQLRPSLLGGVLGIESDFTSEGPPPMSAAPRPCCSSTPTTSPITGR